MLNRRDSDTVVLVKYPGAAAGFWKFVFRDACPADGVVADCVLCTAVLPHHVQLPASLATICPFSRCISVINVLTLVSTCCFCSCKGGDTTVAWWQNRSLSSSVPGLFCQHPNGAGFRGSGCRPRCRVAGCRSGCDRARTRVQIDHLLFVLPSQYRWRIMTSPSLLPYRQQ